jgi:hypothetical protein
MKKTHSRSSFNASSIADALPAGVTPRRVEVAVGHAEQARTRGQRLAEAIANALGLDPEHTLERGPIKEFGRIASKLVRKGCDVDEVGDICRFRIFFDRPEQIVALRKLFGTRTHFLKQAEAKGYRMDAFDDYFLEPKPHGAIGLDMKFEVDLGKGRTRLFEIQLMHRDMQGTDRMTHDLYEKVAAMKTSALLAGRTLTDDDISAIEGYENAIRNIYEADAWRLGLMSLREAPPARPRPGLDILHPLNSIN